LLSTDLERPSGDRLDPVTAMMELLLINTFFNSATRFQGSTIAQNNNRLTADLTNLAKFAKPEKKTIRWTSEVRRFIPKKKMVTQKIMKTWENREEKKKRMSHPLLKGYIRPASLERPVKSPEKSGINGSKESHEIHDSLYEINPALKDKTATKNTNAYIQTSQVNAVGTRESTTPKVNQLHLTPQKKYKREESIRNDEDHPQKFESSIMRDIDFNIPGTGESSINYKNKIPLDDMNDVFQTPHKNEIKLLDKDLEFSPIKETVDFDIEKTPNLQEDSWNAKPRPGKVKTITLNNNISSIKASDAVPTK
jgi:hypothetical protein